MYRMWREFVGAFSMTSVTVMASVIAVVSLVVILWLLWWIAEMVDYLST